MAADLAKAVERLDESFKSRKEDENALYRIAEDQGQWIRRLEQRALQPSTRNLEAALGRLSIFVATHIPAVGGQAERAGIPCAPRPAGALKPGACVLPGRRSAPAKWGTMPEAGCVP